jgi:malate dehydrogenase (oxaloacetate-decarboxylating)(NADP+)
VQVNWTKGTVLFASGSPFPAMCYDGCEPLQPAQANNAYIFPAVGHAAVLTKANAIPNEVSGSSTSWYFLLVDWLAAY